MQPVSIVIICKNEAAVIGDTLKSLEGVSDDIIVYDNGSTDDTVAAARKFNVQVHQGSWEGFGKTKAKANSFAKYDWILSLDADERIDEQLKRSLLTFDPPDEQTVYKLQFRNFLGNKFLRYGEWGNDSHTRLFNRKIVQWNNEPVHETLLIPDGVSISKLNGFVLHTTMKDLHEYAQKTVHYAMLSADKYYHQGKRASWFKIRLSPGFTFFNYYILKLGFLDGYAGYVCARMTAHYTFLKYARLRELNRAGDPKTDLS
ncbi:MAG: glycosyltransferase family 2 protein [Chitinophagaceae bacterium]|nr:glycosyltransferase family 2 protein [Chitinophagaceae bacterium]